MSSINYLSNFTDLIIDGEKLLSESNEKQKLGRFLYKYISTISPIINNIESLIVGKEQEILKGKFQRSTNNIFQMYMESSIQNNNYEEAFDVAFKLMNSIKDENYIQKLREIQDKCIVHVCRRYCEYYEGIKWKTFNSMKNKEIIVTTTTCKRFDLFQDTVNSFLHCCLDNHLISEWLVVDDNSSESDRKLMKEKYPFMTFIFKSPEDKGHVKSMNIIRDYVIKNGYKYQFHIEDDMRFFAKENYLTICREILEENKKHGQCLLNKNYSEESEGHKYVGGLLRYAKDTGNRYYIHEFYQGEELKRIQEKYAGRNTCFYWPHYSLRVGMTRVDALREVGEYKQTDHFEMEYAYRYVNKGFLTTYLDTTFCQHSGRKTWERFDNKVSNAYSLNDVKQFSSNEGKRDEGKRDEKMRDERMRDERMRDDRKGDEGKRDDENGSHSLVSNFNKSLIKFIEDSVDAKLNIGDHKINTDMHNYLFNIISNVVDSKLKTIERSHSSSQVQSQQPQVKSQQPQEQVQQPQVKSQQPQEQVQVQQNTQFVLKTYVINLRRRKDRLEKFMKLNKDKLKLDFTVLDAVDGEKFDPSVKLLKLFENNDFNSRRGVIGCACSHIKIWFELVESNIDYALVLEDDAELCDNFMDYFKSICSNLPKDKTNNSDWDLIYLGHHKYKSNTTTETKPPEGSLDLMLYSKQESLEKNMGGTFGYMISKRGAINMLEHVQDHGVYNGIDWVMFKTSRADVGIGCTKSILNIFHGNNKIYYCNPPLIYSDVVDGNNSTTDSDIQYDTKCLTMSLQDRLKREILYWEEQLNCKGYKGVENKIDGIQGNNKSLINFTDMLPPRTSLLSNVSIISFSSEEEKQKLISQVNIYPVVYYTIEDKSVSRGHKTLYEVLSTKGYLFVVPETRLTEKVKNERVFQYYLNTNLVQELSKYQ